MDLKLDEFAATLKEASTPQCKGNYYRCRKSIYMDSRHGIHYDISFRRLKRLSCVGEDCAAEHHCIDNILCNAIDMAEIQEVFQFPSDPIDGAIYKLSHHDTFYQDYYGDVDGDEWFEFDEVKD